MHRLVCLFNKQLRNAQFVYFFRNHCNGDGGEFVKKNRIIWFCLWIASLVGISYYGGPVSYGFFTVLTLIPIFSLGYLLYVFLGFRIYQKTESRYLTVNETVPFHFSLQNEHLLLFAGIRVFFFSTFSSITGLDDKTEYELLPHTGIQKDTKLVCHYRGEYDVGIKGIEIQDYFRLFRFTYKKESVNAVVKPQLVRLEHLGTMELANVNRDSNSKNLELDVVSREYAFGDEPRLINWSQTARTGTLMTRKQIGQDYQDIVLVMDSFRNGEDPMKFIPMENKILETTLAVAYYLSNHFISATEYHYQHNMVSLPVGKGDAFERFYEELSQTSFDNRNTHQALFHAVISTKAILQSSMIFLIMSYWDEASERLLKLFEQNNIYTVVYLICNEGDYVPDVSDYIRVDINVISPYVKLEEVM